MDRIKISGSMKNYDWGTKGYLFSLFGGRSDVPQAEYWMGTHPMGEAVTEGGEKLSSVNGHPLTFLFKVLSIASPLSLQCHPDRKQAMDGWKREEKARERGEETNYRDDNEKAELISAITPVTALCGFRTMEEIKCSLETVLPSGYGKYLEGCSSIRNLFTSFFSLSDEVKKEILSELEEHVSSSSGIKEYEIVRKALSMYPGDISAVFPMMMNLVHLDPFEALYLEPGTLHAYVEGNAIEIMTASDNVLRGGLTHKRVDVAELERIMHFSPLSVRLAERKEQSGVTWYITPSRDFSLGYVREEGTVILGKDSILLSLGESTADGVPLKKGESLFIKGSGERVEISTDSVLYIATGGR